MESASFNEKKEEKKKVVGANSSEVAKEGAGASADRSPRSVSSKTETAAGEVHKRKRSEDSEEILTIPGMNKALKIKTLKANESKENSSKHMVMAIPVPNIDEANMIRYLTILRSAGRVDWDTCTNAILGLEKLLGLSQRPSDNAKLAAQLVKNDIETLLHKILNMSGRRSSVVEACTSLIVRMGHLGVSLASNASTDTTSEVGLARDGTPGPAASSYHGVRWIPESNKWESRLVLSNRAISIGTYDREIEAAKAYDREVYLRFASPLMPLPLALNFGIPEDMMRCNGGVLFHPSQNMWLARFSRSGYDIPIGYFNSAEDAESALGCANSAFETSGFVGLRMCVEMAADQMVRRQGGYCESALGTEDDRRPSKRRLLSLPGRRLNDDVALLSRAKMISNLSYFQIAAHSQRLQISCPNCAASSKREMDALSREQIALELLHHALQREGHLIRAMNRAYSEIRSKRAE